MSVSFALLVGVLFALAIYLLLKRERLDHVFGIIVLGHASNLLVFGEGRLQRGQAPILGRGHELTDPLPQALVLTAIVIGFAIAAFALALLRRLHDERASPPDEERDE